jgi:phospholipid/cholesterol/gamma-HCH transport system permease protein
MTTIEKINKEVASNFKQFLFRIQEYTLTSVEIFRGAGAAIKYKSETLKEMYLTGAQSFPIVFLAGLFMGIILALEVGHRFSSFGAKTLVGRTVALGMIRELGPVIAGLLLAARVGAKNASELGAMQISEQIDALRAYGISPIQKLVVPRTAAAVIMFLPLTLIADIVGLLGGMLVAALSLNLDPNFFWKSAVYGLEMKDLLVGFVKPFVFGYFVSSISCTYGLSTSGGTNGLGRATINAVVISSIVILFMDFVLTKVVWEIL